MTRGTGKNSIVLILIAGFLMTGSAFAHGDKATDKGEYFSGLDSAAATVVKDFHQALQIGDVVTVRKVLADEVVIFENGGVERSLNEYAAHHMKSDMEFLREAQVTDLEFQVRVVGNIAMSLYRSKVQGRFREQDLDIQTMETLVLMKQDEQWKIVHVHWSN